MDSKRHAQDKPSASGAAPAARQGFTFIELIVVVAILAILVGIALPRYFEYAEQTRAASCKGTLGGVRAGCSNFLVNEVMQGNPAAYPTIGQLTTAGVVMQESIPDNPFNDDNAVTLADSVEFQNRIVVGAGTGWAYYLSNGTAPPEFRFYANSSGSAENQF